MLDSETKRRIDTARDILVGKVPDPKSQVEQITIALIYKFMDDMDAESEELGGERKFFAGEFAKYGWAKLMRSGLGGHEILGLYADAIARMPQNPGIPPLFRDIFKNAYLPYRDPETLRAFLKIIDDFEYDHSERLGDAFEYLLSVLGSQGEAGQFRTPRHIIDFIVSIVNPMKNETVLDPACGTAGFLISSYKHILAANRGADGNSTLTPDERGRLADNFMGYDISPDMVRLSLANMYLHGFPDPHISEYDTLTSQDRWNEYADVILANPPFMSPKGGIKPHNRFSVQSKRSEVLFVDYMVEHLTPGGRAGIVVPEGIIFQGGTAYQQLREMLVQDWLVGVISLPSGVFQPYSGVKTSVLILDGQLARSQPGILFSAIEDIGVSLGIKRVVIAKNDLPHVLQDYLAFRSGREVSPCSWIADREEVLANGCNLTGNLYRIREQAGAVEYVRLGSVCAITKGKFSSTKTPAGPYPLIVTAEDPLTSADYQFEGDAVCVPLISATGHGRASIKRLHYGTGKFALANLLAAVQPLPESGLDVRFLHFALDAVKEELAGLMRGAANVSMKVGDLAAFRIPLPSTQKQDAIVAEIEGYQAVIEGAQAVLDHYRPHIAIRQEWPTAPLGEIAEVKLGKMLDQAKHRDGQLMPYARNVSVRWGSVDTHDLPEMYFEEDELERYGLVTGDVLVCEGGQPGRAAVWDGSIPNLKYQKAVHRVRFLVPYEPAILVFLLQEMVMSGSLDGWLAGTTIKHLTLESFKRLPVPVPSVAEQRDIVDEIEAEQRLVAANRELVARFELKTRDSIAQVWGKGTAPV